MDESTPERDDAVHPAETSATTLTPTGLGEPEDDGTADALRGHLSALFRGLATFASRAGSEPSTEQRQLLSRLAQDLESMGERIDRLIAADRDGRDRSQLPKEPVRPPVTPAEQRQTVLLVEDDDPEREAMTELLDPYFRVVGVADGSQAAHLVRSVHPDAVVTDLCMPLLDGYTLLSTLRLDDATAHIPLLVLSAMDDVDAKIRAFEVGAFDYLTKPVALGELVARIRNAIGRATALRREKELQATDELTGLANRRWLRSFLSAEHRTARRLERDLSVVAIDQDSLKQVNDRFGHAAGDAAIRTVAAALSAVKREADCTARIGGDEFLVVMPRTGIEGARSFINRVRDELARRPLEVEPGVVVRIEASFGAAAMSEQGYSEEPDALVDRADKALYADKAERHARRRAADALQVSQSA